MNKNPELIKLLLGYIRENYSLRGISSSEIKFDGYNEIEISYNLLMLSDENYILINQSLTNSSSICEEFLINRLTSKGEDFYAMSCNNDAWKKVKELIPIGEFVFSLAINIMIEHIAKSYACH